MESPLTAINSAFAAVQKIPESRSALQSGCKVASKRQDKNVVIGINPFAPGDFAKRHVLKLVEWFSDHCRAIKS